MRLDMKLSFFPQQVAIRALGFEVKKADVLKILRDYDRSGAGKISFQDFTEVSESLSVIIYIMFHIHPI